MALIPLKDEVMIKHTIGKDDWGESIYGEPTSHKCRITEKTKLTRNQRNGGNWNEEVVSVAQILLEGKVPLLYEEEFSYVDIAGVERTYKPIGIKTVKDISSKVLFTKVEL